MFECFFLLFVIWHSEASLEKQLKTAVFPAKTAVCFLWRIDAFENHILTNLEVIVEAKNVLISSMWNNWTKENY